MSKYGIGQLIVVALASSLIACGGGSERIRPEATASTMDGSASAMSIDAASDIAAIDVESTEAAQPESLERVVSTRNDTESQESLGDATDERAAVMATSSSNRLGGGVTGGGAASTVHVTTAEDLRRALCSTVVGGVCKDETPRVISVDATIDFKDTEGTGQINGCYYSMLPNCSSRAKLGLFDPQDTHCNGVKQFSFPYDKAGRDNLLVGSNKTLVGKAGGKAAIKGAGLAMKGGVHNIIVRNLTFGDINDGIIFGGDAIILGNTKDIWIDHNRFAHVGRQLIVSGWEKDSSAQNVTVSWNDFNGQTDFSPRCDGNHYWNFLLTGKDETFVFAYNVIQQFSGRAPAVHGRNQFVHLMSNYFKNGSYHALEPFATSAIFMEGNFFDNVKIPILQNAGNRGAVYAPLQPPTEQMKANCVSAIGRTCGRNAGAGSGTADFTADSYALNRAGQLRATMPAPATGAASLPNLLPANVGPK